MDELDSDFKGLTLQVLGGCEITLAGEPVRLESAKTRALLLYLALRPGAHQRHELMGLLWGDFPEVNARRNLRHALWDLRRRLPADSAESYLHSDRDTISFNPRAGCRCDVQVFEQAAGAQPEGAEAEAVLAARLAAAGFYRGDFLHGFHVGRAAPFEEWALLERERLRGLALLNLQQLVELLTGRKEYEEALHYGHRLLALDPWREVAHRQLMRLLALTGQRAQALQQYHQCRRILAEELGVKPATETEALYQEIQAGSLEAAPAGGAERATGIPAQTRPFVGRRQELAQIRELLARPDCRLLTLAGPGGIGKTRLAARVAEAYEGEVFFVSLAGLRSADVLPQTLAAALELATGGGAGRQQSLQARLLAHLAGRELLLVLDNFEHLLPGAGLLAQIVAAAPGVRLLVTSRQRLNLQDEWLFPLAGLQVAAGDAAPNPESYPAGRLFLQIARRMSLGYEMEAADWPHLAALCRLVEGNPLAVELAAAWCRALSVAEIAAEIGRGLDFLAGDLQDAPRRHASLRAVFQHSWRLLPAAEKEMLVRLALFQGGFDRRAAEEVTAVSLRSLARLVDKSLLRRSPGGRYQMHEVIRHYSLQKLQRDEALLARLQDEHSRYYATFLAQRTPQFLGREQKEAVRAVGVELENIRSGWDWAVAQGQVQRVDIYLEALFLHYDTQGWFQEGAEMFGQALAALPGDGLVVARLLARQAIFCKRQGRHEQAAALLQQALHLLEPAEMAPDAGEAVAERAFIHNNLGNVAELEQDYLQAREYYRQALALWQAGGDRRGEAIALNNLGLAAQRLEEHEQAAKFYRASLTIKRELGYQWGIAVSLDNLANNYLAQGKTAKARRHFDEALALAGEIRAVALVLEIRTGQAELLLAEGRPAEARSLLAEITGHPAVAEETRQRAERMSIVSG